MKFTKFWLIALLSTLVFLATIVASKTNKASASYHSAQDINDFKAMIDPIGPGQYFTTPERCQGCHGKDSLGWANVDESGTDVNLYDRWSASMMANSAKDPLWRAKVSHEILVNPSHSAALQDKCVSCHAPIGHYNAKFHGQTHYGIADLDADSLGLSGVSCVGCHTIGTNGLGSMFSGQIPYDTTRHIYGPFTLPMVGPMQLYEGYTPTYSAHMTESKVCSSCHSLATETVDLNGNFTGGTFIEQATYHEYKNSSYEANNITCQNCHMPRLADPILLANGYLSLSPRTPFNQHSFAGANVFMLNLIKNNKNSLGIEVEDFKFDSAIISTKLMLQQKSISMNLSIDSMANDSGYFSLKLTNKAGHKFPSGYPARRAVVQFVVLNSNNDTIFRSGIFDNQYAVQHENPSFEPHHQIINQNTQSQIYEMVMGDVNGQFTSVLERAALLLKDNRITPAGFSTLHSAYDTTKISADALADEDFNKLNGVEGTGSDIVHYHIPLNGYSGSIKVFTKVYYQSVPPKWVNEMFTFNSSPIDTFRQMFNNADHTPVLVGQDSIVNLIITATNKVQKENEVTVWPTVAGDGAINVSVSSAQSITNIDVFTSDGKNVYSQVYGNDNKKVRLVLPGAKGLYLLKIKTNKGTYYRKVYKI